MYKQVQNTTYGVFTLDNSETETLNDILELKLEDYKRSVYETFFNYDDSDGKSVSVRVDTNKSKTTQQVLDIVIPYFEKAGLVINPDNGYIDYYKYKYSSPDYKDNSYCVASMNEAYSNVHVCLLFTRKDENLKYGNINIYEDYPSFMESIGYEKQKKGTINTNTGSVIVLSGETLHKLQGCSGNGTLNYIQVVFYTEKRSGYRYDNDDDEE